MNATGLAPLVIAASAILTPRPLTPFQDAQAPAVGVVHGTVRLTGLAPVRESWPMTDDMRPFHDSDTFEDEAWLLGEKGELKNCVITLVPMDVPKPKLKPLEGIVFSKVGPRYEPRVLMLTSGTEVTFRNVNSPCNGFMIRDKRGSSINMILPAGGDHKQVMQSKGTVPIQCDLREYMRAALYYTDTPYFALSAADGKYTIQGVPPGRYHVRLWHEELGYVNKDTKRYVTVAADENAPVHWTVPSPRKE